MDCNISKPWAAAALLMSLSGCASWSSLYGHKVVKKTYVPAHWQTVTSPHILDDDDVHDVWDDAEYTVVLDGDYPVPQPVDESCFAQIHIADVWQEKWKQGCK